MKIFEDEENDFKFLKVSDDKINAYKLLKDKLGDKEFYVDSEGDIIGRIPFQDDRIVCFNLLEDTDVCEEAHINFYELTQEKKNELAEIVLANIEDIDQNNHVDFNDGYLDMIDDMIDTFGDGEHYDEDEDEDEFDEDLDESIKNNHNTKLVTESLDEFLKLSITESKKEDPKAAVRNRGKVVFPAGSSKVKDDKDHFPYNTIEQGRNAISRSHQYSKVPSWYKGTLSELQTKVKSAVHKAYPSIEISE